MNNLRLKVFLLLCSGFLCHAGFSQEYNTFEVRYQNNLRGDLTLIGNHILNRDGGIDGESPNDPYNNLLNDGSWSGANDDNSGATNYNDYKQMRYVDVDGDPTTFSSSSAVFNFPQTDCNLIRYAGLYWSATYPSATANGSYDGSNYSANTIPVGSGRQNDFNQVRFRVPGGSYVDVTADEILYDGFASTETSMRQNSPYACYADVTAMVTALADPEGEYTVANVRATTGGLTPGGGSAAGWTLVIVYENPTLTGKLISTFDGFARVNGTNIVDINYNGFETIPVGPVVADLGAATLEGDYRITGDGMAIEAASNTGFTPVSNASNPQNNFFNSNITVDGVDLAGRNPGSLNTLGYDTDVFQLNNPVNSLIPNAETAATFRFSTNGDQFYPFFNSFNVEVIEPNIVLEKRVEDIAGNDVTGQGVNLGQLLDYVLTFQNIGNDDATNYTIRDVLPINVTLDTDFLDNNLPAGVTYTFDAPSRTVVFTIPDNLIQENDPAYSIRMRVQVAENCFDFIDACTDLIENLAYSTYLGVINTAVITDDPSVSDFDTCGFVTPGATNFLLDDLESCDFTRTVQLCGEDVLLDAGDNFDSYTWYIDENDNRLIDAGDTVITDGDPDNDPSTISVTETGIYIVDKDVADPCKGFQEIIVVTFFGATQTNPITALINDTSNTVEGDILVCPNDGEELPQIFLCGLNDTEPIQINIPDAESIVWQQLDETSCSSAPSGCANKNNTCTWNNVGAGSDFIASNPGEFRLQINYEDGCFSRFYFNVFQNPLDPQYTSRDIICNSQGNITVTNMPLNYEFQLVDAANGNVLVPYGSSPSFDIATSGAYRVEMRQQGVVDGCVFVLDNIGIIERTFQVDVTPGNVDCNGLGSVSISVLDVEPQYYYEISQGGTTVDSFGPSADNNYTFQNLNAGVYDVEVTTDDGCNYTEQITIDDLTDLAANAITTKNIDCTDGTIEVTGSGGLPNPDYFYAIWSFNGTDLYTDISDIPAGLFQTSTTFTFSSGEEGDYQFAVVDGNNCWALSNFVTISNSGPPSLSVTNTPIVCSGSNTASLTITVTGGSGPFEYSIDDGTTYQSSNAFVTLGAGSYQVRVRDSGGCEAATIYAISEPLPLSASAAVTELAECNPGLGAEVRITNTIGGVAPYEYSFDGGMNYSASPITYLLPGNHSLFVRDINGCTYPMSVTVDPEPAAPNLSATVDYECDGEGTIVVTPDSAAFDYTYEINGVANVPDTSNTFENVPPGNHTVTVNYTSSTPPTPSQLLFDNFGAGANTAISEIDPVYCYEPQDGSTSLCGFGTDTHIQDGEYSVTNLIVNPYGSWRSPNDHSGLTGGRFLAINVGGVAGVGGIIYEKTNVEVVPNLDITVSLWAFNLLRTGTSGGDPSIEIQLVDGGGTVIASTTTGNVPKNNDADDWHNYAVNLNPGANTNLDIVIRTNSAVTQGNDIAIDDVQAFQTPQVCASSVSIDVLVEPGNAFGANITAFNNISCNAGDDGAITFEVENFDTVNGFEYQVNAGGYSSPQTSSTIVLSALTAGNYVIDIRDVLDPFCSVTLNQTLTEPTAVVANASIISQLTCADMASITASASGGTPTYQYQLEDGVGTVLTPYQNSPLFSGLAAGDYIVRARDANNCEDAIDTPLTIDPVDAVAFTSSATTCYGGANDASIVVNVTSGNGNYQFRLNGGPWITPSPTTATTHTFSGLSSGNYTIAVRDSFGCAAAPQNVTIDPQLTATIDVVHLSSCADGSITANATGGDGNYEYAFVLTGNSPSGLFTTTNTFLVTAGNADDYDVYVRDNNANPGYCEYLETVRVNPATPLAFTSTPTDPECHDGAGSILVNITSGVAPYTIQLIDLDNGGASDQTDTNVVGTAQSYYNLLAGNYTVVVTDALGCSITDTPITINNPDELTADIQGIIPPGCDPDPFQYGFRFINYPLTLTGTLEFSSDGGASWQTSDTFTGPLFPSGTEVYPSIRTVDGGGNTICRTDLPRYTIPYPLDDLDISISTIIVNCNELQVTVQGTQGLAPYEYAYTDDPAAFDPLTASWTAPTPGAHTWPGLIPGRTYVFYVRDASPCVRQSSQNVAELQPNPMEIDGVVIPSCSGANDGAITYSIIDTDGSTEPSMRWELFEVGTATNFRSSGNGTTPNLVPNDIPYSPSINITGLPPGEYYIFVTQVDGGGVVTCISGSQNALLNELDPITGTPTVLQDLGCDDPALLFVDNLFGGGGTYTFTVTGPVGFTTVITADNPIEIPANSPSGTYSVAVQDQYGCPANLGDVTLTLPANPTIDNIVVDNCISPSTLAITASSPAAQILYSIDGGTQYFDNGGLFGNVASGSYSISIIDSNGCTASSTVTVNPVLQINANVTALLDCEPPPSNNAEITINVTAGSGNYDYEISGPVNQPRTTMGGMNTLVWSNASVSGDYTVTVYDTSTAVPNCSQSVVVTVPPLVPPNISVTAFENVSCDGANDGSITVNTSDFGFGPYLFEIISGPSSSAAFPIAPSSAGATTATFINLEGTTGGINYTIRVTATDNSCSTTIVQSITAPDPISNVNVAVTEFGCSVGNNTNSASITVQPGILGGSGTYVIYEFIEEDDPNTAPIEPAMIVQSGSNPTFVETDTAGGVYTVNVYDSNGCLGSTSATILPFDALISATATITNPLSCSPGMDGAISLTVNSTLGDATQFEYSIDNGATWQNTGTHTNPEVFSGLDAGTHNFLIRHLATGCVITASETLENPNTFSVDVNVVSDVSCYGTLSGQVSFELIDATYSGPMDWEVFDTNGTPTNLFDDVSVSSGSFATNGPTPPVSLFAGNYYVNVTQSNYPGCTNRSAFTITGPSMAIVPNASEEANVACSNDQGAILVDPEGGSGPYTIQLTNTTTGQNYTQTNVEAYLFDQLSAGDFDIQISDARGCVASFPSELQLVQPLPLVADITPSYALSCFGDTNGTLSANVVSGGFGTLRYQLNRYDASGTTLLSSTPFQSSNTFSNLTAGVYSISLRDEANCTAEVFSTISDPAEVMASLVQTNMLTCNTLAQMQLTAVGGTAPYEFSIDGINFTAMSGGDTHTFSVRPGTYQYFVKDAFGCDANISNQVGIEAIPPLTIDIDDSAAMVNCTGEASATIVANVTGGLGNYNYELYTDAALSNLYAGPQTSNAFGGLPAGDYYVRVTSQDCEEVAPVVTIVDPLPLQIDREEFTNISCSGEEDGTITVEVSGGTGQIVYAITPNLNQFDDQNVFTDLAAGTYDVIAQDENGCFLTFTFEITSPEPLSADTVTVTHEVCVGDSDGTIAIEIVGGTAPYRTALNTNDEASMVQGQTFFSGLASGTYTIFVKDAQDCETNIIVDIDPGVNLDALVEPIYECSDNLPENRVLVTLTDASVASDILYALDSTDPTDMQLSSDFNNLAPGSHYLTIAHANGCMNTIDFEIDAFEPLTLVLEQNNINEITAIASGGTPGYTYIFDGDDNGDDNTYYINRTDTFTVTVIDALGCEVSAQIFMEFIDIEIPNFFTPDGDGVNDFWIPDNLEGFPDVLIKIYDRYGRVVAEVSEGHEGWDGNYQTYPLPTGDYWYVIRLNGENDDREFVGHFTLYR